MYQSLLEDASLFCLLLKIDRELAGTAQASGCPACGGALWLFMVWAEANRDLNAGLLGEAETTYHAIRKSLEGSTGQDARRRLAGAYHRLGRVAEERGDLPSAESWYRRSLEIKESLGNRPGMASSYHQLGRVAQARGDLPSAESWCRQALEIYESLNDRPHLAFSFGQLGLLAEQQGKAGEGLEWMVRCVALFPDFPHPSTGPGPHQLTRFTRDLGWPALEGAWRKVTGMELPDHVRQWVEERWMET